MNIKAIIFAIIPIILNSCGGISVSGDTNSDNVVTTTTTDNSKGVEHCIATITPNYNADNSIIKCSVTLECKNNIMSVKDFIGDNALEQCNTSAEEEAGSDGEVVVNDGTQNSTDNPDDVLGQTT